ncbi:hypothetical protein MRX96_008864 [Rhipicephalus microplus]
MAQATQAQPLIAALLPLEATLESWINYVERLEAFFEADDLTSDSKKRLIRIFTLNFETYARLWSLFAPSKPKDDAYDTIVRVLMQHLSPEPSEI